LIVASLQLRLLVETDDCDAAVQFYRDELGLPEQAAFAGAGEARVAILDAGRATLELANPAQRRLIDDAEVGHPSGPRIRVALEVADTIEMTERLVAAGATLVSSPRETPWRSLNARLDAPAGLQLTLFQELEPLAQRAGRPASAPMHDGPAAPPTPRDRRRRRINATPERNRAPESLTPGITG
jgi:catechol 2,3-dioxygenase-like lactoylglutathione lyase family enzyme